MASNLCAKSGEIAESVKNRLKQADGLSLAQCYRMLRKLRSISEPIRKRAGRIGSKASKTDAEMGEFRELAACLNELGDLTLAVKKQAISFENMQPLTESAMSEEDGHSPAGRKRNGTEKGQKNGPKERIKHFETQLAQVESQIASLDGTDPTGAKQRKLVSLKNSLLSYIQREERMQKILAGTTPDPTLTPAQKSSSIRVLEEEVQQLEDLLGDELLKAKPDEARLRMLRIGLRKKKEALALLWDTKPCARIVESDLTGDFDWHHFAVASSEND